MADGGEDIETQAFDAFRRDWRVGASWGVTIIAEGDGDPDERGHRAGDTLVALALNQELADLIVEDHNRVRRVVDPR